MRQILAITAFLATMTAVPTMAQDVVVMRRQIAPPSKTVAPPEGNQPGGQPASYRWKATGTYGPWSSMCSTAATRPILYDCTRVSDGAVVEASMCSGITRTETTEPSTIYDGCTYTKVIGEPSPYSTTCGAGATRTRANACSRDLDLERVDPPTYCSIPEIVTETSDVYSGCTGSWRTVIGACGTDDVQATSYTCVDGSGMAAPNTCDPTVRPADIRGGCSGTWDSYLATCTSTGTHQPIVRCLGLSGAEIGDSNCNPAKKPSTAPVSCTGTWKSVPGTCTGGSQTPVVTCQKGGATVADGMCNPSQKPSAAPLACVAPATSCGTMVQQWFGPSGGVSTNIGSAASATAARSLCISKLSENGGGTCGWNSGQSITYFWKGQSAVNRGPNNADHLWAANCQ